LPAMGFDLQRGNDGENSMRGEDGPSSCPPSQDHHVSEGFPCALPLDRADGSHKATQAAPAAPRHDRPRPRLRA
jgi:hypothetical protein